METTQTQTTFLDEERTAFRLWLQKQFTERCKKNASYSLRAFAKSLDMDASTLSQILSGKRKLSKKSVTAICDKLTVSQKELINFGMVNKNLLADEDFLQLSADTFSAIADWYHYAILELTFVTNFKSDAKWISRKLSITTEEAKSAIERLKRLALLHEENGFLKKTSKMLTNNGVINTSGAHKELQRQIINKALESIDNTPAAEKNITSMTMAIDVTKLDQAKALIAKFRREMSELMETDDQTRVYNLAVQLYPISKSEENL